MLLEDVKLNILILYKNRRIWGSNEPDVYCHHNKLYLLERYSAVLIESLN